MAEQAEVTPARIGLAFGLAIAAGAATTLATAFSCCVNLKDVRLLSCALGAAAGVMFFVSFAELLAEAKGEIEESGHEHGAGLWVILFFFIGIGISTALEKLVTFLEHRGGHGHSHGPVKTQGSGNSNVTAAELGTDGTASYAMGTAQSKSDARRGSGQFNVENMTAEEKQELKRAGMFTAIAIGLHNIPEGLATFISTIANPSVGASVAVAIGLHNIPEGISVCVPTYFATGSMATSVAWTFFSAFSEPVGALIGYAIVRNTLDKFTFGSMFAIVSGMMVYVAAAELLPNAHRYDPKDKYVTKAFFFGTFIMAISIEMFAL